MAETTIRKLPLEKILIKAWHYCCLNARTMLVFAVIAYAIGALALFFWKSLLFWPVLVLMYILWGGFFRYYLERRPYFDFASLFNSLVPSTKIVVLSVIVCTCLIALPFIPLFVNISPEFNLWYAQFLQGDFGREDVLALVANILFMLVSPWVAYRPFLAWISSLVGRSGALHVAWEKTKGNNKEFLIIALLTNLSLGVCRWIILNLGGNDYFTLLLVAPVVIYFNVVAAQAYEFFFLEVK